MSLSNPNIRKSEKFSDHFNEGERFYLKGIRTVRANTQDYGEGEMVILTIQVQDEDKDYGIWGQFLVEQAHSATVEDLNKWYVVIRGPVPGYSQRPVKQLRAAPVPGQDSEIPF